MKIYYILNFPPKESTRHKKRKVLPMRLFFMLENPHNFDFLLPRNARIYGGSKITTFEDFYYKETIKIENFWQNVLVYIGL